MHIDTLIQKDLKHVWHPTSQMKDYEAVPPLPIKRAQGSYFELHDGRKILDGIASWWCKSLGHAHPKLQRALTQQMKQFEHVIPANTTHTAIAQLSERLAFLLPPLNKVFYASDGACAVEIAVKMSLASRYHLGQTQRRQLMSFKNGYHGETALTLALSDVEDFKKAYAPILIPTQRLTTVPYVPNDQDPLWQDCSSQWPTIEAALEPHKETLSAIIFEPIVQGAGGMRVYSQDLLRRLRQWADQHQVHLIADEIMTGLGRTGTPLACQHAGIVPDFLCLAKNLTAGWLPMSAVLTQDAIYDIFYDDYETGKAFLHSHTHSGNALAASVALACLDVMEEEGIYQGVPQLANQLMQGMRQVHDETQRLTHIRGIGGMVAADLDRSGIGPQRRLGYEVSLAAINSGVLLRPIGDVIYWLPPLNIDAQGIQHLVEATTSAIKQAYRSRR